MSTYMKIAGVKGNVTTEGHEDWIALQSIGFTISRMITMEVGRSNIRQPGKLRFTSLELSKMMDESSVRLLKYIYAGEHIPTVKIDCCHTDLSVEPHLQYELSDVMISHYEIAVEEGIAIEKMQLSYEKLQTRVIPTDAAGNAGRPAMIGYHLAQSSIT